MKLSILVTMIFLPAASLFASTFYVPDHYPSIQSAVYAALDGDTIVVRDGTYMENIDYLGKSLTLQSENGPEAAVIDGGQIDSVVVLRDASGNPTLQGFTLTNGASSQGGGLFATNCTPIISYCRVTGNKTIKQGSREGGGIYCDCPWAHIFSCTISNNETARPLLSLDTGGEGGGIYIHSGSPIIENCLIENNITGKGSSGSYGVMAPRKGGPGGGIYVLPGASASILKCTIRGNETGQGGDSLLGDPPAPGGTGGGIWCSGSVVDGCTIIDNKTGEYGFFEGKQRGSTRLAVRNDGGGIYCEDSVVRNSVILMNETGEDGRGAGIYFGDGFHQIINCTIRGNYNSSMSGQEPGGGIFGGSHVMIQNCILWENSPDQINPVFTHVSYCTIQNGEGEVWFDPATCLEEDPLFASPVLDDCRLTWRSPCINRGQEILGECLDFEGDVRPFMGATDMGADEFTGLHPLQADRFTLSAGAGGSIDFAIDTGPEFGRQYYLMLGTLGGTLPGLQLPNFTTVPINWDGLTDLVLQYLNSPIFTRFFDILDSMGQGSPALHVGYLHPVWVGRVMHYAFTLDMPLEFVSNPIRIEVEP